MPAVPWIVLGLVCVAVVGVCILLAQRKNAPGNREDD